MKIAIPYFEPPTTPGDMAHSVYRDMLMAWQHRYSRSGTTIPVCLLVDRVTGDIPEWDHQIVVVEDDTPEFSTGVLHKVGWLKHQAYKLLGRCLVMDLDAFPRKSLDHLADIECSIAMVPDPGPIKEWPWHSDWPEARPKYNAGVMILDDPAIYSRFREIWDEKADWIPKITFYDEVIFSALMNEMDSVKLPDVDNYHEGYPYEEDLDPNVLHFSGSDRKDKLRKYVQAQLSVPPHGM